MAWKPFLSCLTSAALLLGCQAGPLTLGPDASMSLDASLDVLAAPNGADWSAQQISSPVLMERREAYFKAQAAAAQAEGKREVLAWASGAAGWKPNTTYPGIALSAFGLAAADTMPNGPATTFAGGSVPPALANQIFFLTKNGVLLKVSKYNPTTAGNFAKVQLGTGETFSRTSITLSPACSRAYCLSDAGTLYIVDTLTMKVLTTRSVAGGYGIAPAYDPFNSLSTDAFERLYVPDNAGMVTCYQIKAAGAGKPITVTTAGTYGVANGITPIPDATYNPTNRKIAAPCLVLKGKIVVGDEAGNLQVYDVATNTRTTYALGVQGIEAAPAIEIQDGSYSLKDPFGNPTTVPVLTPIYVFINVASKNGPVCAWVDLVAKTSYESRFIYLDDADKTRKADYLHNYQYAKSLSTRYLEAKDGGNVAMDSTNLPGTSPAAPYSNNQLMAAETNIKPPSAAIHYAAGANPTGIIYDQDGNLWVTNRSAGKVTNMTNTGTILATYTVGTNPTGITVDDLTGDIWFTNQGSNSIGTISNGVLTTYTNAAFNQPTGIVTDVNGNVWVTNMGNSTVVQVSPTGAILMTKTVGTQPSAIAYDDISDTLWIANQGSNNVTRLAASNGSLKATIALPGGAKPMAIAVDPNTGDAWTANFGSNNLSRIASANNTIAATAAINQPQGVVVDDNGNVWATSKSGNNAIQFTTAGVQTQTVTAQTAPYGIDLGPNGIAMANSGTTTVTVTQAPGGGPVYSYVRFYDNKVGTYPLGTTVTGATLSLTTTVGLKQTCYPLEVWSAGGFDANGSTGVYAKGTSTYWTSNGGLTAATAPTPIKQVGVWQGGGINGKGLVNYPSARQYNWDVTSSIGSAVPVFHWAYALRFNPSNTKGNTVYWPGGPLTANKKGNKPPFYAPSFQNNALGANATPPTAASDARPLLTLTLATNTLVPNVPIATSPIIDSRRKKVYVFNTNAVFAIDYTNTTTWTDTAYVPATGLGTKYTTYNAAYWGSAATGGAATNTRKASIRNTTSPVISYDGNSIYVLNFYPRNGATTAGPYTNYDIAVSKIGLPLVPGTDKQTPTTGAPGTAVANSLTSSTLNGNGTVTTPNASSFMVIDPFLNPYTSGGGLYLGLDGTKMIYQFDP